MAALSANISATKTRIVVDAAVDNLTPDTNLRLESEQVRFVNYGTGRNSKPDHTKAITHA
jgi:hypothetical protein